MYRHISKSIVLGGFFQTTKQLQKYGQIYNTMRIQNHLIENNELNLLSPTFGHSIVVNNLIQHVDNIKDNHIPFFDKSCDSQRKPLLHFISGSAFTIPLFLEKYPSYNGNIILEAIPYERNINGVLKTMFPLFISNSKAVQYSADKFVDSLGGTVEWYKTYLSSLAKLTEHNNVYIVHSKKDNISLYEDAYDLIHNKINHKDLLVLENDKHCKYYKNTQYVDFIKSVISKNS